MKKRVDILMKSAGSQFMKETKDEKEDSKWLCVRHFRRTVRAGVYRLSRTG
jgi:hypothetical protein